MDDDAPRLLTPQEVIDYPLRKAARGYAVAAVDDLLDVLADQTRRLLEALDEATGALEERDEELAELRSALADAEQAADAEVAAARRVGEAVVDEARLDAQRVAEDGRARAREHMEAALRRVRAEEADLLRRQVAVEDHLVTLRQFAADHRARLEQHLQHELGRLAALVVPPTPAAPDVGRDPLLDEPVAGLGDAGGREADAVPRAPWQETVRLAGGDRATGGEPGDADVAGSDETVAMAPLDRPAGDRDDEAPDLGQALFVDRRT